MYHKTTIRIYRKGETALVLSPACGFWPSLCFKEKKKKEEKKTNKKTNNFSTCLRIILCLRRKQKQGGE